MTNPFSKFVLALGIPFWLATPDAPKQSLKTVGHMTVFDADGKTVGNVLNASDAPTGQSVHANVAFSVQGGVPAAPGTSGATLFVLNVYSDGFSTDTLVDPPVAWQSNDC